MRICLLVEGSYPYVVGGVSSWVQMLIEGLPEHEFVVYSIGAEMKQRGDFRYNLPKNLVEVHELFLDEILALRAPSRNEKPLTPQEKVCLYELVVGNVPLDLDVLLGIFRSDRMRHDAMGIFMSADFFDIIERVYREHYDHLPFTDFFWTIRSMLLPLFYILQQDFPEADIYHSVATGYCGVVGGVASRVYRKPFLITEHGIYSREREEEILKCKWAEGDFKSVWIQYFYNLAGLAYAGADRVFTLFQKNADTEIALGCAPEKIAIVPNGIHMERFAHIALKEEATESGIVIGAVVRVVPIKDIVTMLRAFFLVKQSIPDAKLLIMGQYEEDPEYYELCQRTIETLRLEDVTFTGSVNVAERLAEVDLLLLSSISEGQPLAVLEGLAAHRPFVTTDVGCCRELLYGEGVDDMGDAGIVVPAMDYEEMSRGIVRMAKDAPLRRRMAEIGYERVKQSYTYEKFINSYRDIYAREKRD
jgi:glycosyltransferase, group 1 family